MKLIKILFTLIVILVIGSVTLSNRSVDESGVVTDLSRQISTLQNENTILRAQVAAVGSLTSLQEKIAQAGFTVAPAVAALPTPTSVALR